jgi:hypothetical protein
MIMVLMATSSAFARKASYHHSKRAAPKHQSATKANDRGGIERHPDDVALDRKIGSILPGMLSDRGKDVPYIWVHSDDER